MIPRSAYQLYLVTDRSAYVPGEDGILDFLQDLEQILQSGVKVVQLREKKISYVDFVNLALQVKSLIKKYNAYLIINDSVEVALEVEADGIHVGQDDLNLSTVLQRVQGRNMVVGVSVSTELEAQQAMVGGASYIGVGPVYPTSTKHLSKEVIHTSGVRSILSTISPFFPVVCISGIHLTNLETLIEETESLRSIDGVAVVSAIMKAPDKPKVIQQFTQILDRGLKPKFAVGKVRDHLRRLKERKPLVHHLTNMVAINDNANVTLSFGGSPIMAPALEEVEAIINISNALLINIGTLNLGLVEVMREAGKLANIKDIPVVLDPVGVGASPLRLTTCLQLLSSIQFTLIKGNQSEISTLASLPAQSRGVDSIDDRHLSINQLVFPATQLYEKFKVPVLMTGEVDVYVGKDEVYVVDNGHKFMGEITASGCMLGSLCATSLAVQPHLNPDLATLSALLTFTVAGELASCKSQGPGTFKPHLINEIYNLSANFDFTNDQTHPVETLAKVIQISRLKLNQ